MILGIDPGPKESAFCLIDAALIIRDKGFIENEKPWKPLIQFTAPCSIAVEHLECFGMPVGKETFETAYWIGEFRNAAKRAQREFIPVYRSQIKMHFCHSMRAKDSNIRAALIDRFGPPGTKKNPGLTYGLKKHLWSAFAIAVYAYDENSHTN